MEKIGKIITKVLDTTEGKCADVFAYAKNPTGEEVTLGYELCGNNEKFMMCYGRISPEDPGDVPSKTFENSNEALGSEYGGLFAEMAAVAKKALDKRTKEVT